jgi:ketosteroid isomerase-like protein
MYKIFIALAASVLVTGPVAASDKTDVVSVIHQWLDGFNKGDMKSMEAQCAAQTSIIDDFPPHTWNGAGACSKWSSDFRAFVQASEITEPAVTIGKLLHVDVTGNFAYVVAPTTFAFKRKGKPVKEEGIITVALQKGGATWRMTGWAWADH